MDLKKKSNILAEEEPKYIISLKEGYRILHIIMSILFLSCTLYFGMISFRAGTDTMVFDIGFTGIVFVFFIYTFCLLLIFTCSCLRSLSRTPRFRYQ